MHALPAAFAVALTLLPSLAGATEGVLIVHSNQRITPAGVVIENTIRSAVPSALARPVEIFSEYLDTEWASTEALAGLQAEYVRQKYLARDIRVIVVSGPQALRFTARHRDAMLPGVPVVHVAVPKDELEGANYASDIVGRPLDIDPAPTLELARHVHPDATRLVVVLGAGERDRIWEERIRRATQRLAGLDVEYFKNLPTAEIVRRLGSLEKNTIVFTPGYFVDGAGVLRTPRQAVEVLASASAAPVYVPLDTFIGTGAVGGFVTPYEAQSREGADIVVKLLNGTLPSTIPAAPAVPTPMVDWRAVRRFGIDERRLPSDAVIRFREPTAWDKYGWEIAAGAAIVLLQAVLILALLMQRRSGRHMATELEASQARMTLAARAVRLSSWIWDVARDRIEVTQGAGRHGARAEDPPMTLPEVLAMAHPADRTRVARAVADAVDSNTELDIEYRIQRRSGEVRWLAVRGRTEKDAPQRMMGVTLDITERKSAELQAERDRAALTHMTRVSMMGQLSASIAHQLNQPLAAILGNAEAARKMLDHERLDLAELKDICDDIVTEDNRAAEVIRRLGALYKRGEMTFAPLDLNDLVRETLDLVRTELMTRHVVAVTELDDALPVVDGGRVQLQQVLLNLILNAADAMERTAPDERTVTIRTEVDGTRVQLCIVDRGTGIAPDAIKHVFDAFWSTKTGGMGIGLAICHSIITAHRGCLTVSNNPDGGATFCAGWPVRQAA